MIELAFIVVEPQQERPDEMRVRCVAESPDHAVRCPALFNLEHGSLAGPIDILEPLGDDAIERAAARLERAPRVHDIARKGRKPYGALAADRLKEGSRADRRCLNGVCKDFPRLASRVGRTGSRQPEFPPRAS